MSYARVVCCEPPFDVLQVADSFSGVCPGVPVKLMLLQVKV
jgi:hypothetical protein